MSTMETPPPEMTPAGPPERRCPRCGSTLAPDQEWCLACGAAAGTEVAESRGWRVPIYLGGGLVALAILGVILAIAALSDREEPAGTATPTATPSVSPIPPNATPSVSPIAPSPTPSVTTSPAPTETIEPDSTTDPGVTVEPTETASPDSTATDPSSTFGGWTGADGDYTIIIESADSLSRAEEVAEQAEGKGLTVGILNSDDFSSLNGGYQVVFSGTYSSKSEAEDALPDVKSDYPDAYVRRISNS